MIKTSKGSFEFSSSGGGEGFKVNAINECSIGFFLLKDNRDRDEDRDYFTTLEDIKAIWDYKNNPDNFK